MELTLRQDDLIEIIEHARRYEEEECCGVLIGRRDGRRFRVERVERAWNVSPDDRRQTFELDPRAWLVGPARPVSPQELIGFYHSHPLGSTHPSSFDTRHAWRGYAYIIVGPDRPDEKCLKAWHYRGTHPEPWKVLRIVKEQHRS